MGHGVMMIDMAIVVVLLAVLLIAVSVEAFPEDPHDMRDTMFFWSFLLWL